MFGLDRFIQNSGLFKVWFRQVYTEFWFIQGFGLDRFIQYSGLFKVLVQTCFNAQQYRNYEFSVESCSIIYNITN